MSSKGGNDDLRELPAGTREFSGIRFQVIDPQKNNRRSIIAVSSKKGYPSSVDIKVHDTASSVYLLHTSSKPSSENVVGSVRFVYEDSSSALQYIIMGKHLTYWWFSELKTDYSGIAWYGKNAASEGVGLSWCAIDNPHPRKKISKIVLSGSQNDDVYTVFAITLSDQPHYVPVNPVSFGGPDDWAAATAMAGLLEGLAGVRDRKTTYQHALVSPRWVTTTSAHADVSVRYAASDGYVSYQYSHDKMKKQIRINTTSGGEIITCHILLPEGAVPLRVTKDARPIPFRLNRMGQSTYADFMFDGAGRVNSIIIQYR